MACLTAGWAVTVACAAYAQSPEQGLPVEVGAEAAAAVATLPAGTVVELEIGQTLNSKTVERGDTFPLRLAEPIGTSEGVLIPAGATGMGQVISASRAGMLGKAGELLLAARYIDYNGQRVPLRTLRLGQAGQDNSAVVMAASFVIPLAFVIKGGNIEIPAGTRANAKLAADLSLPVIPAEPTVAEPPPINPEQEKP